MPSISIRYDSGDEAMAGDQITLYDEASTVEAVINTDEAMAEWGVIEPGLMIVNKSFGRVFIANSCREEGEIIFLARKA